MATMSYDVEEPVESTIKSTIKVEETVTYANGTSRVTMGEHVHESSTRSDSVVSNTSFKMAVKTEDKPLASTSVSPEPLTPASDTKPQKKRFAPQLITDWPEANEESSRHYQEIDTSIYMSKNLGKVPYYDEDANRCECDHEPGACSEDSNCVNRIIQIECLASECRAAELCENQRFQRREFAPIDIVRAGKKGFGVRTRENIASDTFIYEYIGEVIGPSHLQKRLKEYADEGIEHFYFMAIDRTAFIDATRKGCKARFLNHSCNPNCYVAKWTVGTKMRMGIFAKRAILAGEELTFNYNVDRYGHAAQPCYCGEPNCIGVIGGKTQTDVSGMGDLYLDALGDLIGSDGVRISRRVKNINLNEVGVTPATLSDVVKISAAVRQSLSSNRDVLFRVLERIQLASDDKVFLEFLRLHGLQNIASVLNEYSGRNMTDDGKEGVNGKLTGEAIKAGDTPGETKDAKASKDRIDRDLILLAMEILEKLPLLTRNKIEATHIEDVVKSLAAGEGLTDSNEVAKTELQKDSSEKDATDSRLSRSPSPSALSAGARMAARISDLARTVLARWAELSMGYRIPRANNGSAPAKFTLEELSRQSVQLSRIQEEETRRIFVKPQANATPAAPAPRPREDLPKGWYARRDPVSGRLVFENRATGHVQFERPSEADVRRAAARIEPPSIEELVAEAKRKAQAEAERKQAEADAAAELERARRAAHAERKAQKLAQHEKHKEKRLMGLVSAVVVETLSRYKASLGSSEQFKSRAKEVTATLVEKEKKHHSYARNEYTEKVLPKERAGKMRSFVKEWVKKLLDHRKKRERAHAEAPVSSTESHSRASTATVARTDTPPTEDMQLSSGSSPRLQKPEPDNMGESNGGSPIAARKNDDMEVSSGSSPFDAMDISNGSTPAHATDVKNGNSPSHAKRMLEGGAPLPPPKKEKLVE